MVCGHKLEENVKYRTLGGTLYTNKQCICMYVRTYECMYVRAYVRMYVCMYVCICVLCAYA